MDIQLQRAKTAHYCFVTDCVRMARGKQRGGLLFDLEFVRAERIVPGDPHSDVENVPESEKTMTLSEFAAWWEANPAWRVVS